MTLLALFKHLVSCIANECFLSMSITFISPLLTASPASAVSEPSCDVISKAQKLQDEAERSWALSQACAYYQHRCPPGELDKESCIRIMGESCSARVLQCSLLSTMQNLEPATQTHAQGEGIISIHAFIQNILLSLSVRSAKRLQYSMFFYKKMILLLFLP